MKRLAVLVSLVLLVWLLVVQVALAAADMPEGFVSWPQFLTWIASPVALLAIVQLLKVIEAYVRLKTDHPVPPGDGITDRYAIILTGVVAGLVQIFSQVASGWQAPDPMLWIALQAFVMWAVAQFYYVVGKAAKGSIGGLGT